MRIASAAAGTRTTHDGRATKLPGPRALQPQAWIMTMTSPASAGRDQHRDFLERRGILPFPVVGIGASAGGLAAAEQLLKSLPAETGMAFVIVLHLAPDNPSMADAILQRSTPMTVQQVSGEVAIEPDHVYVIPPDRSLAMNDGHLRLGRLDRPATHHVAIDQFFRSLGEVHRERAVAVVLSGAGADGVQGLKRVKERGGVTLVQNPADAEHDSMPLNAIAAGVADFVLPVAEMGPKLMELWANAQRIELPDPPANMAANLPATAEAEGRAQEALQTIMRILQERTGHDFSHYKRATVLRRIERRMQVSGRHALPEYAALLESDEHEPRLLLQDMLISVTNFFRDRAAFDALERLLVTELFQARPPADRARAWIAGCATGEEAYSVAMLLLEHARHAGSLMGLQLFASDIDERALAVARGGIYADSIATDVAPARLRQFFDAQPGQYVVSRALRERLTFSVHNLLRDPPFSRLDLVCCRNVLIYLDRPAQRQVLETFHFALRPGGLLFLGSAETAEAAPEHFVVVDKRHRIYRSTDSVVARRVPVALNDTMVYVPPPMQVNVPLRRQLLKDIEASLKAENAPPAAVIDGQMKIVYLSEHANRFVQLFTGELSAQILHLVPPELRLALRAAIAHAQQTGESVKARRVRVRRGDDTFVISMTVRPVQMKQAPQAPNDWLLVFFREEALGPDQKDGTPSALRVSDEEVVDLQLQLTAAIGESDSSHEALRASNEELQSVNEELRSTTEELETSKEELQSVNEELSTVNLDLKLHLEASAKANDDLHNFIAASDIATVFVDRGMRIQRFTPRAAGVFNLLASDIGRSLFDITHRLNYPEMEGDAHDAFASLRPIEREIAGTDDRWFLARLLPYRSSDDRIEGVMLNFIDVTARHNAEETMRRGEERLRLLFDSSHDYVIIMLDPQGRVTQWNRGAEHTLGYQEHEVLGKRADLIFVPEDRAAGVPDAEMRRAREVGRAEDERWHLRKDGKRVYFSGVLVSLAQGAELGFAKIARDLTQGKLAEEQRDALLSSERSLRAQLEEASALKDEFLAVMSHELKNPLNLIAISAQMLSSQPEKLGAADLKRIAAAIASSVKSQAQLIDDLLDLSRAQTGKLSLHLEHVACEEVVARIVNALQPEAEKSGITLALDIQRGHYVLKADPVRLEQIVWNLVNNAVKFTPPGGRVDVSLRASDKFLHLEVKDTGRGMQADFLPRVFEMFRQADARATTRGKGGLGIGLAIVKSLVEAHGGQVHVASAGPGFGSTFSIQFPRQSIVELPPGSAAPDGDLQGMRILLVDDEPDTLDAFGAILELAGVKLYRAGSAEQALRTAAEVSLDLIVSDVGMPGMDGYAMIERLRTGLGSEVPAIALTGFSRAGDRARALGAGFDEHLGKPLQFEQFVAAVARVKSKR